MLLSRVAAVKTALVMIGYLAILCKVQSAKTCYVVGKKKTKGMGAKPLKPVESFHGSAIKELL